MPQGPWGGQVYGSPQNQLPYQQNQASQWIQGIGMFLQNFRAEREADKAKNQQMFQKGMEQLMMGIPVDKKKLLTYAKKGGIELDMEGPSPEEVNLQKQKMQMEQQQAAQQMLMSGRGPMFASPQTAQQAIPQQAPPPTAPPQQQGGGLMDKFKGLFGGRGLPANVDQSPAMNSLNQIQQMAQMQRQMAMKKMQVEQQDTDLALQALRGDPKAVDYMRMSGKWSKYNDIESLIRMLPEEEQANAKEKYLAHAVGETQLAQIKSNYDIQMAKMSYDQKMEVLKRADDLMKQFSYAPPELAYLTALQLATDPTGQIAKAGLAELRKFQGPSPAEKWTAERGDAQFDKQYKAGQLGISARNAATAEGNLAVSSARLQMDKGQLDIQNRMEQDRLTRAMFESLQGAKKDQINQKLNLLHQMRAAGEEDQAEEVMKSIVNDMHQYGDVTFQMGGREITLPTSDLTVDQVRSFLFFESPELKVKAPDAGLTGFMQKQAGGPDPGLSGLLASPPGMVTSAEIEQIAKKTGKTFDEVVKEEMAKGRFVVPSTRLGQPNTPSFGSTGLSVNVPR